MIQRVVMTILFLAHITLYTKLHVVSVCGNPTVLLPLKVMAEGDGHFCLTFFFLLDMFFPAFLDLHKSSQFLVFLHSQKITLKHSNDVWACFSCGGFPAWTLVYFFPIFYTKEPSNGTVMCSGYYWCCFNGSPTCFFFFFVVWNLPFLTCSNICMVSLWFILDFSALQNMASIFNT